MFGIFVASNLAGLVHQFGFALFFGFNSFFDIDFFRLDATRLF